MQCGTRFQQTEQRRCGNSERIPQCETRFQVSEAGAGSGPSGETSGPRITNQVTKARALEIEEQQGYKVGRKQLRELKEQVTDEWLPRAFAIRRDTRVWIDTANSWLVIALSRMSRSRRANLGGC